MGQTSLNGDTYTHGSYENELSTTGDLVGLIGIRPWDNVWAFLANQCQDLTDFGRQFLALQEGN